MIFLTVGTHEPFDRLVAAFDKWRLNAGDKSKVVAQVTGKCAVSPESFETVESLDPPRYKQVFESADLIVSHAGMGSIITALSLQKPIVVLPRRGHLSETRNDHQLATARKFDNRPGVFVAYESEDLAAAITSALDQSDQAGAGGALSPFAEQSLISALQDFIHKR